jgi:16S rRNA (adenine1518-N6/adenine1519-N6)-dimethyltransferase
MGSLEHQVKDLCERYGIIPDIEFKDQHFLIDEEVISDIVAAANVKARDFVVEIGPGLGHLTERLAQKSKKVLAIEIDRKMSGPLDGIRNRRRI